MKRPNRDRPPRRKPGHERSTPEDTEGRDLLDDLLPRHGGKKRKLHGEDLDDSFLDEDAVEDIEEDDYPPYEP